MREYRRELYKREYHPRVKAFPQVRELFSRIKADGKRIALASLLQRPICNYQQILNVEDLVDAATTTSEVESSARAGYLQSHAGSGEDPEDVIVVGDTPYDAEAAGKVNLRTVYFVVGSGRKLRKVALPSTKI